MSRTPMHTLEEVLTAVNKGITLKGAATVLGVTRRTMRGYAKRWQAVADALEDHRAELVDMSELALRGAVLRGESWAVAFTLRTLGKDEGYTERHEVTGIDGGAIEVKYVNDWRSTE